MKLSKELKTKVRVLDLDLTKDKDLERIRSALAKEKPIVRLLVNNAGYGPLGEFTNVAKEMYLNMMKLNMDAVVELTYDCLQFMEKVVQLSRLPRLLALSLCLVSVSMQLRRHLS